MKKLVLAAASVFAFVTPTVASAAITFNFTQQGTSVVAVGQGSFDISGLTFSQNVPTSSVGTNPEVGLVRVGVFNTIGLYTGLPSFAAFGTKSYSAATSGTGDHFGVSNFSSSLFLPIGYVSGTQLSGTATFNNSTFSSLGLTPGTYTVSSSNDTVTVIVGNAVSAIPEPASWAMMIGGFGMIGGSLRRRGKVRTTASYA